MVRRLTAAIVMAIAIAGCSTDNDAPATPAPEPPAVTTTESESDAVAWAEQVCASVAPEVAKLGQGPNIDPANPQKAKDGLVSYLDTLADALERMIGGVRSAGPPPVPDGQVAADRTIATLEEAKGSVVSAKDRLAAADVSDQAGFQAAVVKVGEDLRRLGELEDPTKGLRGNAELDAAFRKAESCRTLAGTDTSGSGSPSTTSGSPTPTSAGPATTRTS